MNRPFLAAAGILFLLSVPAFARGNEQRKIAWDDLQQMVGQKVRIAMTDGTAIEGKAVAVEPDALTLQVTKTTNAAAYAKGKLLVPRATLRSFSISHPTKHWRITGIAIGGFFGGGTMAGSVYVKSAGAKAASISIGGGIVALGYFLGSAADRSVTTYVVAP